MPPVSFRIPQTPTTKHSSHFALHHHSSSPATRSDTRTHTHTQLLFRTLTVTEMMLNLMRHVLKRPPNGTQSHIRMQQTPSVHHILRRYMSMRNSTRQPSATHALVGFSRGVMTILMTFGMGAVQQARSPTAVASGERHESDRAHFWSNVSKRENATLTLIGTCSDV